MSLSDRSYPSSEKSVFTSFTLTTKRSVFGAPKNSRRRTPPLSTPLTPGMGGTF